MSKILLTGATGFVGGAILDELLRRGHEVLALSRTFNMQAESSQRGRLRFVSIDLANLENGGDIIQQFDPQICIHAAWEGIPDFSATMAVRNLKHSVALCDFLASRTQCRKLIVTGSCWEYGKTQGICREVDEAHAASYFTWAKFSLYQYASLLAQEKDMRILWFRIFYAYGPRQRKGSLIPTVVDALKRNEPLKLTNPQSAHDFVYVGDVARAIEMAAVQDIPSGVYNLGSGVTTTVGEVSRIIERILTGHTRYSDVLLHRASTRGVPQAFWADTTITERILGWRAKTDIRAGLMASI